MKIRVEKGTQKYFKTIRRKKMHEQKVSVRVKRKHWIIEILNDIRRKFYMPGQHIGGGGSSNSRPPWKHLLYPRLHTAFWWFG